jgi:hypothetical protein
MLPWADICSELCLRFPYSMSGKKAPDVWPPQANHRGERIPWPTPNLKWAKPLLNRENRLIRSKIDAASARLTLAQMRLGIEEANIDRVQGAAERHLVGESERPSVLPCCNVASHWVGPCYFHLKRDAGLIGPTRVHLKRDDPSAGTLLTAADAALAKDVFGTRGEEPGSPQHGRGLFAQVSLDGIDLDRFDGGAGVALSAAHRPAEVGPVRDEWDAVADAGEEIPTEDEQQEMERPASRPDDAEALRDRQMTIEGRKIVAGFEMLDDSDSADEVDGRGPVAVAKVPVWEQDPTFDAVWKRPDSTVLPIFGGSSTAPVYFRRLDEDAVAIGTAVAELGQKVEFALWRTLVPPNRSSRERDSYEAGAYDATGVLPPQPFHRIFVALLLGVHEATLYRWITQAHEQLREHPLLLEIVSRRRAEARPACFLPWSGHPHLMPPTVPDLTLGAHWAWTITAPRWHFSKKNLETGPDMRKIEVQSAPNKIGRAESCAVCPTEAVVGDLCAAHDRDWKTYRTTVATSSRAAWLRQLPRGA